MTLYGAIAKAGLPRNFHPVARAAWIGLLATSWNLLPIGQLDGGHVLRSVLGRRQPQHYGPLLQPVTEKETHR